MKKTLILIITVLACSMHCLADDLAASKSITVTAAIMQAAAGVSGTAGSLKQGTVPVPAADIDEGQAAYDALTVTADFNYRPAYVASKYSKNDLLQDIAVSAVEAVPFGFILTFLGIFVYEAAGQSTYQPALKTFKDYTPAYAISIGSLAALNILINTLFFYDYSKENENGKKTE